MNNRDTKLEREIINKKRGIFLEEKHQNFIAAVRKREAKHCSNDTKFRPTGTKFRNKISRHAAKFRFD